jgi:hypothetical protein
MILAEERPSDSLPPCEVCGKAEAVSFSWFADRARWYEPRSGTWRFTCLCTSDGEQYYVMLRNRGQGFLDSSEAGERWIHHLGEKRWFSSADFAAMLDRFMAAGGSLPARGRPTVRA